MRYLFIINSLCNPIALQKLENAIAALDDNARSLIDIRYTQYAGHATEIAAEASDSYNDRITIVACGGDGTVHEIVNGIAYRLTPIIVIPIGNDNDFARSILPAPLFSNPMKIVTMLDTAKVIPIDLLRIDSYDVLGNHLPMWSKFCVNITSIGLDTRVMIDSEEIVKKSKKRKYASMVGVYVRNVLKQIKQRAYRLDYNLELVNSDINEISEDEQFYTITICNGKYYGSGFCPAPNSSLEDGVVDICAIEKLKPLEAVKMLFHYRRGTHIGRPGVRYFKATSGIITCKDNSFQLLGNYDGVIFYGHRIRFEVFPEALNVGILPNEK